MVCLLPSRRKAIYCRLAGSFGDDLDAADGVRPGGVWPALGSFCHLHIKEWSLGCAHDWQVWSKSPVPQATPNLLIAPTITVPVQFILLAVVAVAVIHVVVCGVSASGLSGVDRTLRCVPAGGDALAVL